MFIVFAGRENFQIVFNVMLTKVYGMTILTQQPSCFVLAKMPVNKLLGGCDWGSTYTHYRELLAREDGGVHIVSDFINRNSWMMHCYRVPGLQLLRSPSHDLPFLTTNFRGS